MSEAKYGGHKYTWTKQHGSVRHQWELRSMHGGLHFHVQKYKDCEPSAGLEFHSVYPINGNAPDHINCWLTGGRCWHDGTSLYAMEHLWPLIQPHLSEGDHEAIFRILESEGNRLKEYAPV